MNYCGVYQNRDWLEREYVSKNRSMADISAGFNMPYPSIRYWMKKHDIPIRKQGYNDGTRRKYIFNEDVFAECDSPEKAYFIGFLMADGNVGDEGQLSLIVHNKDGDIIEKFKSHFLFPHPIKQYRGKYCGIRINSIRMVNDLSKFGIVPRKTGHESMSDIPKEYVRDFIRGYFDGDGYITHDRTSFRLGISSANYDFLTAIQDILIKNCNLSKTKILDSGRNCFGFSYHGNNQVKRIREYLYGGGASMCLDRKNKRFTYTQKVAFS